MYGNPEEIRRLAGRVHTEADLTRAEASHGGWADAVQWKSLAAGRYRDQLANAVRQAGLAAGELDEVSEALKRHAVAVQKRLDEIAAAERWLRQLADSAEKDVQNLRSAATQLAESGGRSVQGALNTAGKLIDRAADLAPEPLIWADRVAEEARSRAQDLGRDVQRLRGGDLGWVDAARTRGWAG